MRRGSRYDSGVIEHDLFYEEDGYQFFTADFEPDGFDCLRDIFIGGYRTEKNPKTVEEGICQNRFGTTGNHCGCLQKKLTIAPGRDLALDLSAG